MKNALWCVRSPRRNLSRARTVVSQAGPCFDTSLCSFTRGCHQLGCLTRCGGKRSLHYRCLLGSFPRRNVWFSATYLKNNVPWEPTPPEFHRVVFFPAGLSNLCCRIYFEWLWRRALSWGSSFPRNRWIILLLRSFSSPAVCGLLSNVSVFFTFLLQVSDYLC